MPIEIGWQAGAEGGDEVWLKEHGQWVCRLFQQSPDTSGAQRPIIEEWADKSDTLAEFLEMMHLEGIFDLDTLQRLLSEHAPLRCIWQRLRDFCSEAGDIGEYPATHIFVVPQPFSHAETQAVLPQEYVAGALEAWSHYEAGALEALRSPNLGMVLGKIGALVGQRLGLGVGPSVHFADWLVEAITGWSMGHGNDRTIARLEGVALQAVYGDDGPRRRAFCTPTFWTDYRAAVPAIVAYLRELS